MIAMSDYERGYRQGFLDGQNANLGKSLVDNRPMQGKATVSKKRKASPKMVLLTKMTKIKWDKYKKGKGKKTYVEIRAEVSRSQAYKKKAKGLK